MSRPSPALVIDARPRGPGGPLAGEIVLGRPVLAHLVELAEGLAEGQVAVHARAEEHGAFRALVDGGAKRGVRLVTGPPPEGAAVLRTDRLYDAGRLRRALRRGRDPESAVLWRLDRPALLAGAETELVRRTTYQPLGRFWALAPARLLARLLRATPVRPNHLTLASGALMLGAAVVVAFGRGTPARGAAAIALALALVLDTADGHLARLQGTASDFGRWLDANLDELGEMALHAAIAWAAFVRDGHPAWLVVGMFYGMGKFVFAHGVATWPTQGEGDHKPPIRENGPQRGSGLSILRNWSRALGHADVRWHLWIVLAALGQLDLGLVAYTAYYPARALAGAVGKAVRHA